MNTANPEPTDDPRSTYSARLEIFVRHCLTADTDRRTSLAHLSQGVDRGIQALKKFKPNIDNILEDGLPVWDRLLLPEDRYPIGGAVHEFR